MADDYYNQLIIYIEDLISKGYSPEYIRNFLSSQGISQKDIDYCLRYIQGGEQQLVDWTRQQLQSGYNVDQVKKYLLGYYPRNIVNAVISNFEPKQMDVLYTPAPEHERHLKAKELYIAFIALFIVVIIGFTATNLMKPEQKKLLDVSTEPALRTMDAGDDLVFVGELTNMGADRRYDILLIHKLINPEDEVIDSKETTIAIETGGSFKESFKIPKNTESGIYYVETTARYDDLEAKSRFQVRILGVGEAPELPKIEEQIETEIEEGEAEHGVIPSGTTGQIGEQISQKKMTYEEQKNNINRIAEGNPAVAKKLIKDIDDTKIKDRLATEFASEYADASLCEEATPGVSRDSCYIGVVGAGVYDTEICVKVMNPLLKSSCYTVVNLNNEAAKPQPASTMDKIRDGVAKGLSNEQILQDINKPVNEQTLNEIQRVRGFIGQGLTDEEIYDAMGS
ncbi:hypothetical protein JW968_01950 [Candidatus Woesearchaeota archaeon]|nr:hypothetical protein [Candidatus Woesearchaeota archaeon]